MNAHEYCTGKECATCVPKVTGPSPYPIITTDMRMADGVFAKTMGMPKAGMMVAQHSHAFAHVSVLVRGSLRVWKDDVIVGDFTAPAGITIPALAKHKFLALEDNTMVMCVHAQEASIHEEHNIWGEG